ncbi:ATJ2, partial [Symbiodinium pilosum]
VPESSGNTMASTVQRWLDWPRGNDPPSLVFEDSVPWPDNRPCSGQRGRAMASTTFISTATQDHSLPWLWMGFGLLVAGSAVAVVRRPRRSGPARSAETVSCEMTQTS